MSPAGSCCERASGKSTRRGRCPPRTATRPDRVVAPLGDEALVAAPPAGSSVGVALEGPGGEDDRQHLAVAGDVPGAVEIDPQPAAAPPARLLVLRVLRPHPAEGRHDVEHLGRGRRGGARDPAVTRFPTTLMCLSVGTGLPPSVFDQHARAACIPELGRRLEPVLDPPIARVVELVHLPLDEIVEMPPASNPVGPDDGRARGSP